MSIVSRYVSGFIIMDSIKDIDEKRVRAEKKIQEILCELERETGREIFTFGLPSYRYPLTVVITFKI